ncbi:hypothetical protein ACFWN5_44235 [Streptomyces sp. NPDC058430]|uniref:hypothetical protein n=1 Tax=unclassified Streptomyces TaxID=2593676 RepID=UPI003645B8E7
MSPTTGIDESAEKAQTRPADAELRPQTGFGAWPSSAQVWSWSESAVLFGYGLGSGALM